MWTAALAFVQPAVALLRPYWKYIVIAAALIGTCWYAHNWYEGKLDAAYQRGVAVTRQEQAVIAQAQKELNDQVVADLKTAAAVAQAKLEGKVRESEIVAANLRAELRTRRVCTDERSGRAIPENPAPAAEVDGASNNEGSVGAIEANAETTVGDDLVTIGEQCQINTDKLLTLQPYTTELYEKLKMLEEASRKK